MRNDTPSHLPFVLSRGLLCGLLAASALASCDSETSFGDEADAVDDVATDPEDDTGDDAAAAPDANTPDADAIDDTTDVREDVAPFELVPWEGVVQPLDTFLCAEAADPAGAEEKVYIDCALEGADYRDGDPEPTDTLIVAAYNFERGRHVDEQVALFRDGDIPMPDVLLASEMDRGCPRSGERNTAREFAEGLGLTYVYAVEFVELTGADGDALCEHGNAIFSRYPLANVRPIRHRSNTSWYWPDTPGTGEPRLGGRIAIAADVVIGERVLHVVSLHFESHPINGDDRDDQALELAEHGLAEPNPVIIGGDMNAPLYWLDLQTGSQTDPTVHTFLDLGYVDAHAELPGGEARSTAQSGLVIDLVVGDRVRFSEPGVCSAELCDPLSDHRVIWTRVALDD